MPFPVGRWVRRAWRTPVTVDVFDAQRLPYMARLSYITELRHFIFWGVFAGLVEGTVSAVVVSKTFVPPNQSQETLAVWLLIAVVQATPAFANLMSLFWGALLIGRPKMPVLLSLGAASAAVALSVAFTPAGMIGGWIFALQICLSRVFMSGVVTTRASLWKSNYPRSHRARITANLQIVRTLMSLPVILCSGLLFDWNHTAYRWFYPAIAVVGAIGLFLARRMRVRGERAALARRENGNGDAIAETGVVAPFSLVALVSPWTIFRRMRQALRDDPRFARYCTAQMCIGFANLMAMPVNTIVLTRVLRLTYTNSNVLLDIVPRAVTLLMLPVWAKLFDRVGVLRFRKANTLCWCGSLFFCGLGALGAVYAADAAADPAGAATIAFGLTMAAYWIGRLFDGLAQSGGAIAWNIGHLHFAEDDRAELYMGIHVSLTGLRGLVAPFLGTVLYSFIDWGVFALGVGIAAIGYIIFARLAAEEETARRHRQPVDNAPAQAT